MTEISVSELYTLYLDSLARCTSELLHKSDDEIQYNLFEEFDVGVHAFLHEDSLVKLRNARFIDDEMVTLSKEVRARWLVLQNESWTIEDIKSKKEWRELFALCDRLMLKAKHY